MFRKGKFNTSRSLKRPYFIGPLRKKDGKICGSTSSKILKRETNRKIRHMLIDINCGSEYKRMGIGVRSLDGDLDKLHDYVPLIPEDEDVNHVVVVKGGHYFPK